MQWRLSLLARMTQDNTDALRKYTPEEDSAGESEHHLTAVIESPAPSQVKAKPQGASSGPPLRRDEERVKEE
ncbi:hypothetical protein AAFF_G00235960 [Aldrovandia affinis]|uniref:Uncharacterized protein n=1 Tax=Aldrovandia affinis TaxID=143900 RepID=A0AAD7RHE1_9TELE|nr:hypothetical protein AAFF_G00235960 [Aldrovandia affinis]